MVFSRFLTLFLILALVQTCSAEDWLRFRGPNGQGVSDETGLPSTWSDDENLVWKCEMPGPGASSPIVVGDKVLVTCYSGYGQQGSSGAVDDLVRHLVCVHRESGDLLWSKEVPSKNREDEYRGAGVPAHGYSSSTPVSDGENVFVFYGKTGVIAYDLDGNEKWNRNVGTDSGRMRWGSAASPILHGDLVIVNASDEDEALVGLDKNTGDEVWKSKAGGLANTWGTPILMDVDGKTQILIAVPYEVWALNPENGKLVWYATTTNDENMNISLVAYDDMVVSMGERGGTSSAVRVGGRKDTTEDNVVWTQRHRGRIGTPVVVDGMMFWFSSGIANCANIQDGELLFQERMSGGGGGGGGRMAGDYASPVAGDGKIYVTMRDGTIHVVAAKSEFEVLSSNRFESDRSTFSATPAISNGQLFVRSNTHLYCIGDTPR